MRLLPYVVSYNFEADSVEFPDRLMLNHPVCARQVRCGGVQGTSRARLLTLGAHQREQITIVQIFPNPNYL